MMTMPQISPAVVVFDFDGTIADTLATIVACYRATYEKLGTPAPSDERIAATVGLPLSTALRVQSGFDDDQLSTAVAVYRDVFSGLDLAAVQPIPGMPDVVRACVVAGFPVAVASSRSHQSLDPMLKALGLFDCMSIVVDHTDAGEEKPHPAMLFTIARSLDVPVTELVMIGDTTFDIRMGHAAGCATIGVSWGSHSRSALEETAPSFLVDETAGILDALGIDESVAVS